MNNRARRPLAGEQMQRRAVVELDVVERIGGDLGGPHQAGLEILQDEQLDRAEGDAAQAHHQPDLADMADEFGGADMGHEDPEQGRIEHQQERRGGPHRQQHELALDVVADLDLLLVVVGRLVDLVVAARLEEQVADLAGRHGGQPADQRGHRRIGERHDVGAQEARRAHEVERLVDLAVMVVAMVVPALHFQFVQETAHGCFPCSWRGSRGGRHWAASFVAHQLPTYRVAVTVKRRRLRWGRHALPERGRPARSRP